MDHLFAHEANIARYRALLEREQDPVRRAMIATLLADEERRQDPEFIGIPRAPNPLPQPARHERS